MASPTVANHTGGPPPKRPKGILKNPSHTSPPTSPKSPDQPLTKKELTIANTEYNAGNARTPSASRRAKSRTPSSHDLAQEPSQRLKWDEANLYLTEQERSPKMKIDEPKTPFARGYDSLDEPSDDEDFAGGIPGLELGEPERRVPERRLSDGSKTVHVDDTVSGKEEDKVSGSPEEEEEKHRRFEELRKRHYEMRNAVQLLGHTEDMMEEEDNESEEDDGAGSGKKVPPPVPSVPQKFQSVNGS